MTVHTADISNICEYEWYEWVMFRDNTTSFQYDKQTVGRYLDPATDVGSSMWYKILRTYGQVACQTTVRSLTLEERAEPEHKNLKDDFDTHVTNQLKSAEIMKDFYASDLTPECVYYKDHYSNIHEGYSDEVLPTPEPWDNYVNMETMLHRGD